MEGLEVRRFALKFDPPTLIVEYKIGVDKTVLRKISFRKCRGTPREVCDKLLGQCKDILGPDMVSEDQVRDLVDLLLSNDQGASNSRGSSSSSCGDRQPEEYFDDLNRVSEEENVRAKALMNQKFELNRILPGAHGYEYDKRVDFTPTELADWDDEA